MRRCSHQLQFKRFLFAQWRRRFFELHEPEKGGTGLFVLPDSLWSRWPDIAGTMSQLPCARKERNKKKHIAPVAKGNVVYWSDLGGSALKWGPRIGERKKPTDPFIGCHKRLPTVGFALMGRSPAKRKGGNGKKRRPARSWLTTTHSRNLARTLQ